MPERFIGHTLGKYRVESLLGTGGFAWVFAASDPDLGVTVALKVLKPQYAGDPEFEERFRREASTAARLRHPNIIKIYAVGAQQQSVYFAMDLYTQKLTQQVGVMGCLPEPAVLKLGLDVSSALGFAHRQGVIHRDIKTDNILFDDHGNAIVADFGIARAAVDYAEHTGTNVIMGTPQFFAPEQARGHKIDPRADIYSLGVTLFAAATGELPFDGTDWYEIATKHVHEPPPSPRSINPLISAEMERIILKCLEKDRDNRYPTADLLYADFEAVARKRAGESNIATIVVSTPVTGRYQAIRPQKPKGQSPLLAALVFLLAFGAAAAVFLVVENAAVQPSSVWRFPGVVIGGDSVHVAAVDPPDSSVGSRGSNTGQGSGGGGSGGVSGGNPQRFPFSVTAPADAAILINGELVGQGQWRSDTLSAGNYRVHAVLAVAPDCKWGRDSIVALFSGDSAKNVPLQPQYCGSVELLATRGDSDNKVDGEYKVLSGSTVLVTGRVPNAGPFPVPVGYHKLSISAPLCQTYNDSVLIVRDSLTSRTARMFCTDFQRGK